jgi:hypothetical protein
MTMATFELVPRYLLVPAEVRDRRLADFKLTLKRRSASKCSPTGENEEKQLASARRKKTYETTL